MFRQFIGPQAPAWISMLATFVTVYSAIVFGCVLLYVITDRRRRHPERMSGLPLNDGQETRHV
jgi:cbb3-type cytochrome oxidase subunit 3